MTLRDILMLALFLAVFSVVPFALMLLLSRHSRHKTHSSLRECPHCGAQNDKAKDHCYCCGLTFILPQPDGADPALIQRVRQEDDSRLKRTVGAQTSQSVDELS
jgi:hypothetical protein